MVLTLNRLWPSWLRTRWFRGPLPRLLLIGDSISVHYAPYLEDCLRGRFTLLNREGAAAALADLDVPLGANWGDSSRILERLRSTGLLEAARADLALVNCGLHDIKRLDPNGGMPGAAGQLSGESGADCRPVRASEDPLDLGNHHAGGR